MNQTRVLIVDSDTSTAAALGRVLEAEGFEVLDKVTSGESAVTRAMQREPDLVLMDVGLEGTPDALAAAESIQRYAALPIVFIKGPADDETEDAIRRMGPFSRLEDFLDGTALRMTIEGALFKNQSERKLADSQLQLQTILSSIPTAIIETDADGNVRFMNPVAELFAQKAYERAKGKSVWDFIRLHDIGTEEPLADPGSVLFHNSRSPRKNDPMLLLGGEGRRTVEVWSTAIVDSAGMRCGYVLAVRDITDRHAAQESQGELAAALQNMDDAVVLTTTDTDEDGPVILYANEAFGRLSGRRPEDAVGQPLQMLRAQGAQPYWHDMMEALANGETWRGEGPAVSSDEYEFLALWSASIIRSKSGQPRRFVISFRDVTHMRRMEESIRQSQKIEAVGRLAGGIAHDFNNLLSVINSYCDLQILKLQEDTPPMKYARQIRAAGRKGAELVSQLMAFSRRDKPNPTTLDLSDVVNEVQGMLRRVIREDIELEVKASSRGDLHIRADQGQIEQALLNLCVNARDAMPSGGQLTIETSVRHISDPQQSGREIVRPGDYVVLSVADSGCGMDEKTQQHIFDPFFTTKEIGKGTGLGLATVFSIMKQSNGYVQVKSRPGEGARFELLFPATDKEGRQGMATSDAVEPAPEGSEVVLVVEDDETFLDCISGLLSLHGYEVHTAPDGQAAVEIMEKHSERIHLLVSDLVLPKLSGREVAARLLEKNSAVKVIFMTGYDDQLDTFYSLPSDALILEKPFPLNTLLVKVRELLDEKSLSQ